MGKTTGFLEYKRTDLPDRDPLKRIIDWNEIHLPLDLDDLRRAIAACVKPRFVDLNLVAIDAVAGA